MSGATLSPTFDAATTTYSATVANTVTQVTITETTSEPTATIEYLDGSDATRTDADTMTADLQVNLSVGSNIVKVKVTAPDTTTTETYTVNVFRFAVPGTGTQVWSATLTAGEVQVGGTVLTIGFNQYTTLGASSYGSLSDDDFDLLGTTYTIETLTIALVPNNSLQIKFSSAPADQAQYLTLQLGSAFFPLALATLSSDNVTFIWSSHGLSWSNNDMISVSLTSTYTPPPPAPEPSRRSR